VRLPRPGPGEQTGQRGKLDLGVNVGDLSGGENRQTVPVSGIDAEVLGHFAEMMRLEPLTSPDAASRELSAPAIIS
jgi:hypothetical protein